MQGFFVRWKMKAKAILLDELAQNRALFRISHEIIEKNKGTNDLVLVGIHTRGVPMAKIIQANIEKIENVKVPCGYLDITLYRDDLSEITSMPKATKTEINFDIKNKKVVQLPLNNVNAELWKLIVIHKDKWVSPQLQVLLSGR